MSLWTDERRFIQAEDARIPSLLTTVRSKVSTVALYLGFPVSNAEVDDAWYIIVNGDGQSLPLALGVSLVTEKRIIILETLFTLQLPIKRSPRDIILCYCFVIV